MSVSFFNPIKHNYRHAKSYHLLECACSSHSGWGWGEHASSTRCPCRAKELYIYLQLQLDLLVPCNCIIRSRVITGAAMKHSATLLSVFFALLAVIGQVGQNVSLPLWTGYTEYLRSMKCAKGTAAENSTGNGTWSRIVPDPFGPVMDPYFVVSAASFSFVVIFGLSTLAIVVVQTILNRTHFLERTYGFITVENDLKFPQWQLLLIGVFDALNGILVVFASPPSRTAPFLQAILGNFMIPLTILFR